MKHSSQKFRATFLRCNPRTVRPRRIVPNVLRMSAFQFGDVPIDGLIAASNLTAYKNFVPEAFVTSIDGNALLVDNLNS